MFFYNFWLNLGVFFGRSVLFAMKRWWKVRIAIGKAYHVGTPSTSIASESWICAKKNTKDRKWREHWWLGGGDSNIFYFHSCPRGMIQFYSYFSNGLKPPTRWNYTTPETNMAPSHMDGWKMKFPFGARPKLAAETCVNFGEGILTRIKGGLALMITNQADHGCKHETIRLETGPWMSQCISYI